MAATLLKIHPHNPSDQKIGRIINTLKKGGMIIYPTDTVYGLGCDLFNKNAIDKLCRLIGIKPHKLNLSFICHDLCDISDYARNITTPLFKLMKKSLPGPYTFILNSRSSVPKILGINKKTVGIRVPDNEIPREIVRGLGNPLINASLKDADSIVAYMTDPEQIYKRYKLTVDIVIDGGPGGNIPSTVIDCTGEEYEVVREGLGDTEDL